MDDSSQPSKYAGLAMPALGLREPLRWRGLHEDLDLEEMKSSCKIVDNWRQGNPPIKNPNIYLPLKI
jgi:hypothetical protein